MPPKMLKLVLQNESLMLMKNVLETVTDRFVDANFNCSSSGFSVQAMDRRLVALVELHLGPELFKEYQCDNDMSMGINLNIMAKTLKCAEIDDSVTLEAVYGASTATVMLESHTQDIIGDIEMKVIPEASKDVWILQSKNHHSAIVTMPSAEFATICTYLSSIGDTVDIFVAKEELMFSTKGYILATSFRYKHKETPENSTIIKMEEPENSTFLTLTVALSYLNSFTKATAMSGTVTIGLTLDRPVVVEYKINEGGHIRFYLSPLTT